MRSSSHLWDALRVLTDQITRQETSLRRLECREKRLYRLAMLLTPLRVLVLLLLWWYGGGFQ